MIQDIRYAMRMLLKSPAFFVVAFFAIALGIGVNTTIFGLVNSLLLRPLPVGHPEELVQIYTVDARNGRAPNSYLNYLDFAEENRVFRGIAAYQFVPMGFSNGGETSHIYAQMVSGNYFALLDVQPMLGRAFSPEEDSTPNANPVAVLAHRFWKKLGGDPEIIGRAVTLNGRKFTVIGIAPANFTGTDIGAAPDLWVPLAMRGWVAPGTLDFYENRRALMLNLIARLNPGVTITQAAAQMKIVAEQLVKAYPEFNQDRSVTLTSLEASRTQSLSGPGNERAVENASLLLLVAAGGILLIASANVANLLLARATTRRREMAVRLALGASRTRLVRQLLTESILLAVLGGIGGIIFAYWFGDVLVALIPVTPLPIVLDPSPDLRVLCYALCLALLSGMIFGLAPALQSARSNLSRGLSERAATSGGVALWSLRNFLVVAQIATSLLLLIGSGLFLKAFQRAQNIPPGFRTENLTLTTFNLNLAGFSEAHALQAMRDLLEQMRRQPQVRNAALGEWVPLGFGGIGKTVFVDGDDEASERNRRFANVTNVTANYFETLGIPLLKGRKLSAQDSEKKSRALAIINEAMARQFWPNEESLGQHFRFFQSEPLEVIGVAGDTKLITLGEAPAPMVYLPMRDAPKGPITLFLHTEGEAGAVLGEAHRTIRALDTRIPIIYERTIAEHMAGALWPAWMGAVLLGAFGLLALVLASMGVYGVMAYAVSQRTRELGIRLALGAQSGEVVRLVLRQGMSLAAIGLLAGLIAAWFAARLLRTLLYGVNPNDPVVFALMTSVLAIAALLACYFPARRAVKVDPVIALRSE